MKKSRYSDSQIISILKQAQLWHTSARAVPRARHEQCQLLQMAG